MRVLLDTHTLVWSGLDSDKLSDRSSQILGDAGNSFFVSSASVYEISFKWRIGKWPEVDEISVNLIDYIDGLGISILPITGQIMAVAGLLPSVHRDPFDRMIAAHSIIEAMPVLSADAAMDLFNVERLWD